MSAPNNPVLRLPFAGDITSPRFVRRAFAHRFAGHQCLEIAALCLSEVVSNAVLHGGTGGTVVVSEHRDGLRVEVTDSSPAHPIRRTLAKLSPTGRGLHLLDALTSRWGVDDVPAGGKVVWFEITSEGRA